LLKSFVWAHAKAGNMEMTNKYITRAKSEFSHVSYVYTRWQNGAGYA